MIGIDIVEIEDFSGRECSRIFTQNELAYINNATSCARKTEVMAGIFAAKEAVFKALRLEKLGLDVLKNIEILHKENGCPYCTFEGKNVELSISHTHHTAVAVAIVG